MLGVALLALFVVATASSCALIDGLSASGTEERDRERDDDDRAVEGEEGEGGEGEGELGEGEGEGEGETGLTACDGELDFPAVVHAVAYDPFHDVVGVALAGELRIHEGDDLAFVDAAPLATFSEGDALLVDFNVGEFVVVANAGANLRVERVTPGGSVSLDELLPAPSGAWRATMGGSNVIVADAGPTNEEIEVLGTFLRCPASMFEGALQIDIEHKLIDVGVIDGDPARVLVTCNDGEGFDKLVLLDTQGNELVVAEATTGSMRAALAMSEGVGRRLTIAWRENDPGGDTRTLYQRHFANGSLTPVEVVSVATGAAVTTVWAASDLDEPAFAFQHEVVAGLDPSVDVVMPLGFPTVFDVALPTSLTAFGFTGERLLFAEGTALTSRCVE